MSEPSCPGCAQRDAALAALHQRVADLEAQVRDLQARLGANASNSSLPPSANPPAAPPPVVKKRTGRKTGGQKGHRGHQRLRLPRARVQHVIPLIPTHCEGCRAPLPHEPSAGDPEPVWHQFAELPKVSAVVTEFQGHARTCPGCGHVTREPIPAEIRAHAFGPRLAAVLGYLSGSQYVSQRGLEDVCETVFGVPLSLGSVTALQGQLSEALRPAHEEIAHEVRQAPVKNVEETGWKQAGDKRWLWAAVTATAAFFLVQARRGAQALRALLGEAVVGLVCSDRWGASQQVPLSRRQVCWAHLRRDFQAMIDRGGPGKPVGERLLAHSNEMFDLWHQLKEGKLSRGRFQRVIKPVREAVKRALKAGLACGCGKTAGTCNELLEHEEWLWTFVQTEGVEPTNNEAERAERHGVLWRKTSGGTDSPAGSRFVERILTVVETCHRQGKKVLDYLSGCIDAYRLGQTSPSLLPDSS